MSNSAAANRYRGIMESLATLGVVVQLIVTEGYQSKQEKTQLKKLGRINDIEYVYIFPFIVSGYLLKRIFKYFLNPLLLPYRRRKIRILLNNEKPGTVVWPSVSLEQLTAVEKCNHDLVLFFENNEFPDIHKYQKGNPIQKWLLSNSEVYFEQRIFPKLDGMALMSRSLVEYYYRLPPPHPKFLHLPMTVDLSRFDNNLEIYEEFRKPYIIYAGLMNNLKDGIDILIEAFYKIADQFKSYSLYLVGPWHYDTPTHLRRISDLGLSDRIIWKGEFNRDVIPAILKNASLLVLPRPASYQAQGGFPTKLGEYLASSNPVCATTIGELPDYLVDGESVFFADPGSVDSLAGAMFKALNDPKLSETVGINGRKVAELHFNMKTQGKILYKFLRELSESKKD
jgi:glycosyltransferase involved in cell wall biosynthesis